MYYNMEDILKDLEEQQSYGSEALSDVAVVSLLAPQTSNGYAFPAPAESTRTSVPVPYTPKAEQKTFPENTAYEQQSSYVPPLDCDTLPGGNFDLIEYVDGEHSPNMQQDMDQMLQQLMSPAESANMEAAFPTTNSSAFAVHSGSDGGGIPTPTLPINGIMPDMERQNNFALLEGISQQTLSLFTPTVPIHPSLRYNAPPQNVPGVKLEEKPLGNKERMQKIQQSVYMLQQSTSLAESANTAEKTYGQQSSYVPPQNSNTLQYNGPAEEHLQQTIDPMLQQLIPPTESSNVEAAFPTTNSSAFAVLSGSVGGGFPTPRMPFNGYIPDMERQNHLTSLEGISQQSSYNAPTQNVIQGMPLNYQQPQMIQQNVCQVSQEGTPSPESTNTEVAFPIKFTLAFDYQGSTLGTQPPPTSTTTSTRKVKKLKKFTSNWNCAVCCRSFKSKGGLSQHNQQIHSGPTPHGCDICGKRFKDLEVMQKHRQRHLVTIKPFPCGECPKQYFRSGDLQRHVNLCHGMGRFSCSLCGKVFDRADHVTDHELSHENGTVKKVKRTE